MLRSREEDQGSRGMDRGVEPHTVVAALAGLDCDDFSVIAPNISIGIQAGQRALSYY